MNITDEKFVLYYHTNPVVEYLAPDIADGTTLYVSVRLIPDWTTPSMCDASAVVTDGKATFTLNTFTQEFQRVCRNYDMAYLEVYEKDDVRKVYLQRRIGIKARAGTIENQPPSPTPDTYYTSVQVDALLQNYVLSSSIDTILSDYVLSSSLDAILGGYVPASSLDVILSSYVLSSSMDTILDAYVLNSSLDERLSNYVLSSSLNAVLDDYVLDSSLNSILSNYVLSSSLDIALSGKEDSGVAAHLMGLHSSDANAHSLLFAGKEDAGTAESAVNGHNSDSNAHAYLFDSKENAGVASTLVANHAADINAHNELFSTKEDVGVASSLITTHNNDSNAHLGRLVPDFGGDHAVLVCDGGTASKWQYGDTYEVVITNTIKAKPNAVFEIDMYDNKTINIEPPIENDVDFGIVVVQGDVPYSITLSGVGCSIIFSDQSEVPLYNESNLPQSIAGTNTAYMIRFHWDSYSKSLLSNVAYGVNQEPVNGSRGAFLTNGNTVVSSSMIFGDINPEFYKLEVYNGGRVNSANCTGNIINVYSGGYVNKVNLATSGTVYSGGVINSMSSPAGGLTISGTVNILNGSGNFNVYGGTLGSATNLDSGTSLRTSNAVLGSIQGGYASLQLGSNTTVDSINLNNKSGLVHTSSGVLIKELNTQCPVNLFGGTIASAYITSSDGYISTSNTCVLMNYVLDNRASLNQLKSGGSAYNGVLRNSATFTNGGGYIKNLTISSGAQYNQTVTSALANDIKVESGGSATIRSAATFNRLINNGGATYIMSCTYVSDIALNGGDCAIQYNTAVSDIKIESNNMLSCYFGYNQAINNMIVSNGGVQLISNANINNLRCENAQATISYNSGAITNAVFNDGTYTIANNSSISSAVFNSGTYDFANNSSMSDIVFNGGIMDIGSGSFYGLTINDGSYTFAVNTASGVVMNGGTALVARNPFTDVRINGGTMIVDGNAVLNNVFVGSNGTLQVNYGLASNVTSETGATIVVAEGGTIHYK